MKILKWLAILFLGLVVVVGLGIVSLVYLVDWNDQKQRIQSLVKTHTGRDLEIAGDLSPSVFPWAGISVGGITLSNAQGFGDEPFARIGSADVKVELLPLLRRTVNIRTVTLAGMELDLQRAADGTTNWDDLVDGSATTSTTTSTEEGPDGETEVITTEVEGSTATIAALSVGGIDISDASVHWRDAQADMDATLSGFDLQTGAIALNAPFELTTDFDASSTAMDMSAEVESTAEVTLDLERQTYTLNGFTLDTTATGGALPGGEMTASLGANVVAALGEQRVVIDALVLQALGTTLGGEFTVTDLNTAPQVSGRLASDDIDPGALFDTLGIARPVTADASVLSGASLALNLAASPQGVAIDELVMTLDDTTLTGTLSVPTLAAAVPPLRFDLALDAIDVDRYLPPADESEEGDAPDEPTGPTGPTGPDAPAGGDVPIELPEELMRQLDVDGVLRIGSLTVSGLGTTDIVIPVKAAGGKAGVQGMSATLYEGVLDASAGVDVSGDMPVYSGTGTLEGIQADPLLGDLTGGRLDLVVCVEPPEPVAGIETVSLLSETLAVYAPPGTTIRDPSTWGPWVLFPSDSHTRRAVEGRLIELGVKLDIAAESHQPDVLREMVRLGIGWTVLPRTQGEVADADLVVGAQLLNRRLVLARRAKSVHDPAADDLADRLRRRPELG